MVILPCKIRIDKERLEKRNALKNVRIKFVADGEHLHDHKHESEREANQRINEASAETSHADR